MTFIEFVGTGAGDPAGFSIVEGPQSRGKNAGRLGDSIVSWLKACCAKEGPTTTRDLGKTPDGWLAQTFSQGSPGKPANFAGHAWTRESSHRIWLLYGYTVPRLVKLHVPLFQLMFRTFDDSPGSGESHQAEALASKSETDSADHLLAVLAAFWLVVVAGLVVALVVAGRRGPPRRWAGAALFGIVAGGLYVLAVYRQAGRSLFGGFPDGIYSLRLPGIQVTTALATLGLLGWLVARRRLDGGRWSPVLSALLMLNVALQGLHWLYDLYGHAIAAGEARLSVAQAVVILLALGWELAMSGEAVNGESRLFPRPARVLLFCGYVMVVATAVLYFSSLHVQETGERVRPQFESEVWPQTGITELGVPLLLCLFAFRLGAARRARSSTGVGGAQGIEG